MRGAVEKRSIESFEYSYKQRKRNGYSIAVSVMNKEQLEGASGADMVYMPIELFENSDKRDNYIVELPKVTYNVNNYINRLKQCGAKRVAVSTYGTLKALMAEGFECVGNYGLNVYNPLTACEYANEGIGHLTLSPELSADEIRTITENTDAVCEALVYGRQMMMTTRACLIKGIRKKCDCERTLKLTDKTGAEFLVCSDKFEHINMLYNSAVTFMADKKDVIRSLNLDVIRLVFTDETKADVKKVLGMYKGTEKIEMPEKFTRGYFSNSGKNKQRGRM